MEVSQSPFVKVNKILWLWCCSVFSKLVKFISYTFVIIKVLNVAHAREGSRMQNLKKKTADGSTNCSITVASLHLQTREQSSCCYN